MVSAVTTPVVSPATFQVFTDRIKVLLLSIHYPFAIKSYFERALMRRPDVDLVSTGPYTNTWIPWMGGMTLDVKYASPPTIPLPFPPNVGTVSYDLVRAQLPNSWKPDIVLTIDAGVCWSSKPHEGIIAHVATDPHVINYDYQRGISDFFFNMQAVYMKKGDIYLPYAFDPSIHYVEYETEKDFDAVLLGMPYPERIKLVDALRDRGVTVIFDNGPVFEEYRHTNNRAFIGLNWSSMEDLNARVFELMAMGLCPVINRVPDLSLFFDDGVEYVGFDDLDDAVNTVIWLKRDTKIRDRIAKAAHDNVWRNNHTYDARINTILETCGLV